jgi:hypothetical protein
LLVDDYLLEMSHDDLAILDREADLASRYALRILVDRGQTVGSALASQGMVSRAESVCLSGVFARSIS